MAYVVPHIEAAGLSYAVADLATMQSATATLADDVDHVHSLVGDRPAVLVGHSYGGVVISEAALGLDGVRQLVYVATVLPDEGETMLDWFSKRDTGGLPMEFRDDGTAMVTQWGDVERDSEQCIALLERNPPRPFAVSAAVAPVSGAAWKMVPSLLAMASRDSVIHPDTQAEVAPRARRAVKFDCDHMVQGECPSELAAVTVGAVRD